MKNRDYSIDTLRAIGLILIILVHASPSDWLVQIRSFDVPLMIFVSGLTASGKYIDNYRSYLLRRTKRLIVPVWTFLVVYLTTFYFAQYYILPEPYLTWEMIWRSFLLLDNSIGYVWIIRVFLLMMFLTSLLTRVNTKVSNKYIYYAIIIGIIFLQEGLVYASNHFALNGVLNVVVKDYLLYLLGYMPLFMLGLRLREACLSEKMLSVVTSFLAVLIYIAIAGKFNFSSMKYPPHSMFIVYGILWSSTLWTCTKLRLVIAKSRFLKFVGQNTIWIYLWHMPFALLANLVPFGWEIKFILIFCISLCIFSIQYLVVSKINSNLLKKYFIG